MTIYKESITIIISHKTFAFSACNNNFPVSLVMDEDNIFLRAALSKEVQEVQCLNADCSKSPTALKEAREQNTVNDTCARPNTSQKTSRKNI